MGGTCHTLANQSESMAGCNTLELCALIKNNQNNDNTSQVTNQFKDNEKVSLSNSNLSSQQNDSETEDTEDEEDNQLANYFHSQLQSRAVVHTGSRQIKVDINMNFYLYVLDSNRKLKMLNRRRGQIMR